AEGHFGLEMFGSGGGGSVADQYGTGFGFYAQGAGGGGGGYAGFPGTGGTQGGPSIGAIIRDTSGGIRLEYVRFEGGNGGLGGQGGDGGKGGTGAEGGRASRSSSHHVEGGGGGFGAGGSGGAGGNGGHSIGLMRVNSTIGFSQNTTFVSRQPGTGGLGGQGGAPGDEGLTIGEPRSGERGTDGQSGGEGLRCNIYVASSLPLMFTNAPTSCSTN
ncbi:MAG: hypothetical protein ACNA8W_08135, partial [Bradymonadaceae bacterium]